MRQRKNIDATKEKKIGLYDRTVKVLIQDISNFAERPDGFIPTTKPKKKSSNVIEEKYKYEINRVTSGGGDNGRGPGIDVTDVLQWSSTVEFNDEQEFVEIMNQKDINDYYENTVSVFPSEYEMKINYPVSVEFECDFGGDIGEMEIEAQVFYVNEQDALNGDGELDSSLPFKISYKVKPEDATTDWQNYEKLHEELSWVLPFIWRD